MTSEQYKTYSKISEEIKPIKDFLEEGCGIMRNKFQCHYPFQLIVRERQEKKMFFYRKWHCCSRTENEFDIPKSLQLEIIATAERWLKQQEEFLENI